MYYANYFTGVRPFEPTVLGSGRERPENPLDLSLKNPSEAMSGAEHDNFRMLLEQGKLAVAAAAAGLSTDSFGRQIPLIDPLIYSRLPYRTGPQCPHPNSANSLLGQSIPGTSPFYNSGSSVAPNPHLGLMPSLLSQQNRDSCLDVTSPSVASFMDTTSLPFHMRLNSNLGSGALGPTGSRSSLFTGPLSGITPHLGASFASSIPHFALYTDLLSDINRRSESEKDTFSVLRAPTEPTTRFSDHLQRLREQHVQQMNSQACCVQTVGGQSCCVTAVSGHLSDCGCCNKGVPCISTKMQAAAAAVVQSNSSESASRGNNGSASACKVCKDVCSNEVHRNNNGNLCNNGECNKETLITTNITHSQAENQIKSSNNVPHLWNPTLSLAPHSHPQPLTSSALKSLDENNANNAKSAGKDEPRNGSNGDVYKVKIESTVNAISKGSGASNVETNYTQSSCEVITIDEETRLKSEPHSSPATPSSVTTIGNSCNASSGDSQNVNESFSKEQRVKSPEAKLQIDGFQSNGIKQDPTTSNSVCDEAKCCKNNTISIQSAVSAKAAEDSKKAVDKKSLTKQLKEYKIVPKSHKSTSNACRKAKETKTIEIQCDGPDWTPIVLPLQFKNRLLKSINRKSSHSLKQTKESKKKKRLKKDNDENEKQRLLACPSPSPSGNSIPSSGSSAETRHHSSLKSACDVAEGKSRKRSMLDCLANSEGYVADKVKKKCQQADLFASDPSQLDREERAIQRAIQRIEKTQKRSKSDTSSETDSKHKSDVDSNTKSLKRYLNDEDYDRDESLSAASATNANKCRNGRFVATNNEQYCIVGSHTASASIANCKRRKKLPSNSSKKEKKDTLLSSKEKKSATKTKRELRERLLEKNHEHYEQEENQKSDVDVCNELRKENEVYNQTKDAVAADVDDILTVEWAQKKAMSSVRRRRFRSGLDMIRNPKRKKAKNNRNCFEWTNGCTKNDELRKMVSESERNANSGGGQPCEMKRIMVNKALGETVLHRAARQGYKDVVMYCLQTNTCDINARDNAGYTPLHECCSRGHLQIAKALLEHGGDVNASAAGGIRPLHDAVEGDHLELVRLLLSYAADPTISTYSGLTPLKLARSKRMVRFLRGFLSDITDDFHCDSNEPVLPWKFKDSLSYFDATVCGFDVFDGIPSDEEEEESDEFLLEVSDSPHVPCFRLCLPGSRTAAYSNCVRLSDVLKQIAISKEEFTSRYPHINVITLSKQQFESSATCSHLLQVCVPLAESDAIEVLVLDDSVREVLGIETIRLR